MSEVLKPVKQDYQLAQKAERINGEIEQTATVATFGTSEGFQLLQRVASALSKSTMVPKEYQDNLPNSIIALNMANRIGADPMMVMQNLYIVHGKPSWSSQFLIAIFNACGRFSAIRYRMTGEKGTDSSGCIAWAVEKETGEVLEGTEITIGMAKKEGWATKSGSKWQSFPEHMLKLRAAAWLVRVYAPELAMGLHTREEIEDTSEDELSLIHI